VDENLVHKDQTYDLTLPSLPPPAKDGQTKSVFLLTGPRYVDPSLNSLVPVAPPLCRLCDLCSLTCLPVSPPLSVV
jgi:hypothetical protein